MSQNAPHNDADEIQNDEIVGRAIRWSIGGLAVLAAGGLLIWQLTQKPVEQIKKVEDATPLPAPRVKPPLEIPSIQFTDIAATAGVNFDRVNGADGEKLLPETMGGGGAFFDCDGDGDSDLLCLNGTAWPWANEKPQTPTTSKLYLNDGKGNFSDATAGSGLDRELYANGVACGDYDNDGDVDLFITCVGTNVLFRNEGQGKFVDATAMLASQVIHQRGAPARAGSTTTTMVTSICSSATTSSGPARQTSRWTLLSKVAPELTDDQPTSRARFRISIATKATASFLTFPERRGFRSRTQIWASRCPNHSVLSFVT